MDLLGDRSVCEEFSVTFSIRGTNVTSGRLRGHRDFHRLESEREHFVD
jgi:hypothetical protein